MTAKRFWDGEPQHVQDVLNLANMRDDATPEIHDGVLALFAAPYADKIASISDDLYWADRFRCGTHDSIIIALSELIGEDVRGDGIDVYAIRMAEELETGALEAAVEIAAELAARAAA